MAEEKKKMSRETKKKIRNAVIAGVLLAALSGGGFVFAKQQQTKAKAAAQESTVNTGKVTREDITQKISSTGTIAPKDTYTITALVTGTIVAADFEEGDVFDVFPCPILLRASSRFDAGFVS